MDNLDMTEMDNDEEDPEPENASEVQILTWRTLIELVKANNILYEKKQKGYIKKSDKILKWNNIGALLVPPISGIDAEKEFYRLRQKFGKERRKVLQSQARSGAGTSHVAYKSNWILYNDLMFLADHIQPRQTTSNYQRFVPVRLKVPIMQASQQVTSTPLTYPSQQVTSTPLTYPSQQVTSTPLSYPTTCTPPLSFNESSDLWNKFESVTGSSNIEDEKLSSTADSEESSLSAVFVPSKSSSSSDNASTNVLKTMASAIIPKKRTPPVDTVKKRKRGSSDEIDEVMLQSSKNVSSLASTLDTVLQKQISSQTTSQQLTVPGITLEIQSMMGSIALGLSKVSAEYQMECLIRVLSCINEYANK